MTVKLSTILLRRDSVLWSWVAKTARAWHLVTMQNLKILLGLAIVAVTLVIGWQVGASVLANVELRDEMQDMASQMGGRIGLANPSSDDDFRRDLIRRARQHGIELTADEVTVQRSGAGLEADVYLAADYQVPINLLGLGFSLHFHPESGKKVAAH